MVEQALAHRAAMLRLAANLAGGAGGDRAGAAGAPGER
jgi:hypothetical protein